MIRRIRQAVASWRFRQLTRPIDRQIADARKKHQPVKHLLQAKSDLVHAALRGHA
ncbi:MAG: hypothetical protein Q7T61_01075 [Caulobacter sp.]|nr:hypothetical protein [Caulobacter sp.]